MVLALAQLASIQAAHIVLASASPRRIEILNHVLKLEAEVLPSTFEEDLDKGLTPAEYVQETAMGKAHEVAARFPGRSLIVGADTVVVSGDAILEKPKDAAAARAMLGSLSGSTHSVCTGVALVYSDGSTRRFVETTRVTFATLSADCIESYIESGEPFDKAGGYGIQGRAGAFVQRVDGCYYNVVGFPLNRLSREIAAFLAET